VTVVDVPERQRFEALVGADRVGFAAYQRAGNLIGFTHTEVDRAYEGRGVGGALMRYALDSVRAEGTHSVLPISRSCLGSSGSTGSTAIWSSLRGRQPRPTRAGRRASDWPTHRAPALRA